MKDRAAKYQIVLEGVAGATTYDGSVQAMSGVVTDRFTFDGVEFTVANYKSDIAGKDAGEYVQTITSTNEDGHWTVKDAGGNDVGAQFSVTAEPGKLTIDPKEVTITSDSAQKTYDGTLLTKRGASVTAGGFVEGEEAGVSYAGFASLTDAGSTDNAFDVAFDGEKAKAGNYSVTKVPGKLTVSKRSVTLTSGSGSKTYDGTALTNKNVTIGGQGFANGQGASYDVAGSITDSGSVDNSFTYALTEGTEADNYTITKQAGTLKVSPVTDKVTVTITGKTGSGTYNGSEQGVEGYDMAISGSSLYDKSFVHLDGSASAKGTNAGTYKMDLTADKFSNISSNFSSVKFVVADGSFIISPKAVTVAWESNGGTEGFEYDCDGRAKTPSASMTGAIGPDVLTATLSYKKDEDALKSAPSDPGAYTATVTGLAAAEGSSALASNYALSAEADLSKSFTIKDNLSLGAFWFAKAKADSPESTEGVLRGADGAYKTEDQVKADVAEIQKETEDGTTEAPGSTFQEYEALMEGDAYHLYTKWEGGDATKDADKYVEFRIIQVGSHDNDGSALTFAATHSLPTAKAMNSERSNAGGWSSSAMRGLMTSYVQAGLSGLASSKAVKAVSKTTAYRVGDSGDWSVTSDGSTTSDSFWLLSNSEVFGDKSETNTLISDYFNVEGSQYDWFKEKDINAKEGWNSENSAIGDMGKARSGSYPSGAIVVAWWLRSPDGSTSNTFGRVYANGRPRNFVADCGFGVVPAFAM